jgi:aminoglycoside phosphotransferase (APT) family kinase protein
MHDPSEMPARVTAFLAVQEPEWSDIAVTSYEVMTGGYSRLLARADVSHAGGSTVLVLRGDPPPGRALIDTDRRQEFDVIRTVGERGVRTPTALYFDDDGSALGTRALVISFSSSTSLLPHAAAGGALDGLPARLAEAMASYHAIPVDQLPAQLERPASWDDYIGRRIDEWRRTADAHVEDLPILRYVAAWLDAHRPAPVPLTLIHGDMQGANVMIDGDGNIEILDWELASIGDPREDMGYFKAVAQISPPDLLDDAGAVEFCARYREITGMTELELNPVVVAYFLILGVVGTVRRLLEGGADYARGQNTLLTSAFSLNSVIYGEGVWIAVTKQLEAVFAMMAAAAAKGEAS